MQNATSAPQAGAGHNWTAPSLPSMYSSTHQRSTSNPRYTGQDASSERRDDSAQAVYAGDQYAGYPPASGGYSSMNYSSYGGSGGGGGVSVPYAGSSRRTSGPKAATPPASAAPANPSPGSQYYAGQRTAETYPSSAPPQVSSHHQSMNQPQTAHPYGNYYNNYYDQSQHQPGQWQSHYQNYPSSRNQPTSTTPTVTNTSEPQRSGSFEYPSAPSYPTYDRNQPSQPWQASRTSMSSAPTQWQGGYPPMPPSQVPPGYQWQQYPGYGYPPAAQPQPAAPAPANPPAPAPAAAAASAPAPTGKKSKKEKKDKGEYSGLGKRPAETVPEPEPEPEPKKESKKSKKAKKEEEKPVPKPPAKSHLHPPRQAQSAWQLFFTDELNKAKAAAAAQQVTSPGGTVQHAKLNVAQIAKDAGIAYSNLNDEQKAYYAQKVQESKEQYARELVVWQATLTPDDIRAENAFRAQQRKDGKSRKGNLKDPNAPKKPLSAYFLFLKGIREDDDLRARVWADETETTKQSVLAAERWRGLSDEEKKPYLSQAEKDKQEYEAARKVYEDDAAARARGETVPDRDPYPEPAMAHIEAPKSLKDEKPKADFSFTHESENQTPDEFSMADEFQGFHDPLEGMDLSGLEGMGNDNQDGNWDELQKLIGEDKKDVDEAPVTTEAVPPVPTAEERDVAAAAEGKLAVPDLESVPAATATVLAEGSADSAQDETDSGSLLADGV